MFVSIIISFVFFIINCNGAPNVNHANLTVSQLSKGNNDMLRFFIPIVICLLVIIFILCCILCCLQDGLEKRSSQEKQEKLKRIYLSNLKLKSNAALTRSDGSRRSNGSQFSLQSNNGILKKIRSNQAIGRTKEFLCNIENSINQSYISKSLTKLSKRKN